jgi:hypothetical protein
MRAMKKSITAYREAYQQAYYRSKRAFYMDPDAFSWPDYWAPIVAELQEKFGVDKRGAHNSTSVESDDPRRQYQLKYQRARRNAMEHFAAKPYIRAQYENNFAAYWVDTRDTWLPDFFVRKHRPARPLDISNRVSPSVEAKAPLIGEIYSGTPMPRAVAVCMHDDPEPDQQPWLAAA